MCDRSTPVRAASRAWYKRSCRRVPSKRDDRGQGRPGPGLLAHVVSSKYSDHLPLYRLEQIFERHGVQITRRTLSEWNGTVADLLEPIVRAMHREQVCQSPRIQCDDTTLNVHSDRSWWAARTGCSRGAKRRRTGPPSYVRSSRPANTSGSIRSYICARSSILYRHTPRDSCWG
ncbi:MAG: IS66 family transposase [Candidatus Binataceae bacterium]